MKSLSSVWCIAAALLMAVATPAHSANNGNGAGNSCSFDAGGTTGLAFGNLDPSIAAPVTVTAAVSVGDCASGQTMALSIDQGQHGSRSMLRAGGTELISYSVSTPTFSSSNRGPGIGIFTVATFTGTVQPSAYQDAVAGDYSDQLTVTVTP